MAAQNLGFMIFYWDIPTVNKNALGKLGSNKGVGNDEVPAELLHAGGDALVVKVSDVHT